MESFAARQTKYTESVADIGKFWAGVASEFHWQQPFSAAKTLDYNFDVRKGPIHVEWFADGTTNACYNCLDAHFAKDPEFRKRVAFYWEGNDVGECRTITYGALHEEVTKLADVLKRQYGIVKGDRVSLYLPMIVEAPIAMLACARIGAICSVVFGGFSANSLAARLIDSQSKLLITADGTMRADKPIRLKQLADAAMAEAAESGVECKCLVVERHARDAVPMVEGRDCWWGDAMAAATADDSVEWVPAEHPLFMLYTSGSTGKPKGLIHSTGGYMVYATTTFRNTFQYKPTDVYFCTADVGWITGHSYVVYGPLCAGATSVLFEGVPTHPTPSRWWEIVDKYAVSIFYTAPTAIRSLMKAGEGAVKKATRQSLRVLGSVGEPINVAAWEWFHDVVGDGRCDICDTWWQTETGGHMITPMAGARPQKVKPGSATQPALGVVPVVTDTSGVEISSPGEVEGLLCIRLPWPGIARTIYNDHARYEQVYFTTCPGFYFSGDGCRRDEDGDYWLTGRVDDVVNVSGHRLGTSEVECAINKNPHVVESAVVGFPHDIKGEGIYAYVTLREGVEPSYEVLDSIKATVRQVIGPLATPDFVQPAPGLPKTRSGKIMRRILRKVAGGETEISAFGDISTLAEQHVVADIIELRARWVIQPRPKKQ
jgi:acetyl-CoA synthetase